MILWLKEGKKNARLLVAGDGRSPDECGCCSRIRYLFYMTSTREGMQYWVDKDTEIRETGVVSDEVKEKILMYLLLGE